MSLKDNKKSYKKSVLINAKIWHIGLMTGFSLLLWSNFPEQYKTGSELHRSFMPGIFIFSFLTSSWLTWSMMKPLHLEFMQLLDDIFELFVSAWKYLKKQV